MSGRVTAGDPFWVQTFLARIPSELGWCGLRFPCICSGPVVDAFASAFHDATGLVLPERDYSHEVAIRLALGFSFVDELVSGERVRARMAEELLQMLYRNAEPFLPEVREILRNSYGDILWRRAMERVWERQAAADRREAIRTEQAEGKNERREERRRQHIARLEGPKRAADQAFRQLVAEALEGKRAERVPLSRFDRRRVSPAYLFSRYEATLPGGVSVALRHGQLSPAVDEWMKRDHPDFRHWAFVTAWNPFSQRTSDSDNKFAQESLVAELRQRAWPFVDGVGGLGSWSEASVLVLIPKRQDGIELGRRYKQTAVLVGRQGGHAAVVPCEARGPRPLSPYGQ